LSQRQGLIGFPESYGLWQPTPTEIVAQWQYSWLAMALVTEGWSIHHLVNDSRVKQAVRLSWKARREMERDNAERHEKNWLEYLDWVGKLVGFGD